ncbi:(3aS,4S,5R,7aS)-5-hydroxy-7a-methyl-1-oxo-octahydro-1H-indene-4-carboxyl-CoA dehydrogenase [Salvia divinorum]|uniref:(3aS,4S,5R, 7aS)-5-hydroxy-7a-methyl-1-oxo-octahydro-1H-indene-4-carboxyl-CoA dehydrogenase n=1 Tax=Salvia divinorum TaxID=28513 RepID=A0ABD1FRQ0_SALDI
MGWRGVLGFEYGIIQAPLGPDISGPELVAAVANAGCLGFLRIPDWEAPDYVRELIRKTRALTDKPFGIGVVLAFPHEENIKVILEEKVAVLQVYWGECSRDLVLQAHQNGVKIIPQVGSFEEAEKAVNVGVDGIMIQGREAGGHVIGQDGLIALLPRVVDLVRGHDIPVIAAGGIVDERGYVAALALGAQGVALGTRFLATEESFAHPIYKRKLVELQETEYTDVFGRARWPDAPHRVLINPSFMDWRSFPSDQNESDQPIIGRSLIHGVEKQIRRFAGTVPNATTTGDIESMVMYAGEGVGLIKEIIPASQVIERLVKGAQVLIQKEFPSE